MGGIFCWNRSFHYNLRNRLIISFLIALALIGSADVKTSTVYADEGAVLSRPAYTEPRVAAYFRDIPIMADIARCESRNRHLDKSGNILRGEVNSRDVGVMQINERYHLETALELGYDIYDFVGNMAYARYLYETQGVKPWSSSKPCWGTYR